MSLLWRPETLAIAAGARPPARPFGASGVSIDSRTLRPGDLFVALEGEHRDGHDFVADALSRGAAGALVSRLPPGASHGLSPGAPLLMVTDTLAALRRLGEFARARSRARITAITGSVGKTTTKEMLRLILEAAAPGQVHAARASYNNQWGVPLTLAELPEDAQYAILEIGMNHPGEIAPLAALARPHAASITGIEKVHIGYLGSLEAIADEKASLLSALEAGGTAVLPRDTPFLSRLAARVPPGRRLLTYGTAPLAEIRLIEAEPDHGGTDVLANILGRTVRFRLAAAGRHLALDALAALACATALGLDPEAASALRGFTALPGRGARRTLALPGGGEALLLDESYNASQPSVRAALSVLALEPGRRIAVLGDMLELGEMAEAEHLGLAADVSAAADLVFVCGPVMSLLFETLPPGLRGGRADDAESLAPIVASAIAPGDAILVKGSLGSRMRRIVEALLPPAAVGAERG
ncbi:MAG: UDP-N-acetylmuramoyl-tripeptide--D-alanyl-D-alanine ligase [Acetobacteraceae bacterium]